MQINGQDDANPLLSTNSATFGSEQNKSISWAQIAKPQPAVGGHNQAVS
jgi:hypothetical protein